MGQYNDQNGAPDYQQDGGAGGGYDQGGYPQVMRCTYAHVVGEGTPTIVKSLLLATTSTTSTYFY